MSANCIYTIFYTHFDAFCVHKIEIAGNTALSSMGKVPPPSTRADNVHSNSSEWPVTCPGATPHSPPPHISSASQHANFTRKQNVRHVVDIVTTGNRYGTLQHHINTTSWISLMLKISKSVKVMHLVNLLHGDSHWILVNANHEIAQERIWLRSYHDRQIVYPQT